MIVVLDACVLFPMYLRDTLLRCAEAGLFEPRWSAGILSELRAALGARVGVPAARRLTVLLSDAFPEATTRVPHELIARMTNHPGDRHVLATSIAAQAGTIVTDNVRHFTPETCGPIGVQAVTADEFLRSLLTRDRARVLEVLCVQASEYDHPPMDLAGLLARLETSVPRFSDLAGAEKE